MKTAELRRAHQTLQRRLAAVEPAKAELSARVLEAAAEGWSFARIARELGISRSRAQQLVEAARRQS